MNNDEKEPRDKYGNKIYQTFAIFYRTRDTLPKLLEVQSEMVLHLTEIGIAPPHAYKIARLYGYVAKDGSILTKNELKRWKEIGILTENNEKRTIEIHLMDSEHEPDEKNPEPTLNDFSFLLAQYDGFVERYWRHEVKKDEELK